MHKERNIIKLVDLPKVINSVFQRIITVASNRYFSQVITGTSITVSCPKCLKTHVLTPADLEGKTQKNYYCYEICSVYFVVEYIDESTFRVKIAL